MYAIEQLGGNDFYSLLALSLRGKLANKKKIQVKVDTPFLILPKVLEYDYYLGLLYPCKYMGCTSQYMELFQVIEICLKTKTKI